MVSDDMIISPQPRIIAKFARTCLKTGKSVRDAMVYFNKDQQLRVFQVSAKATIL